MKNFMLIAILLTLLSCAKDKTPPVIHHVIFEAEGTPPRFNRGEEVIFSFEATDNKGLKNFMTELYRDDSLIISPVTYFLEESGANSVKVTKQRLNLSPSLDTGKYVFRLIVIDGNNNYADHFDTIRVVGDTIYSPLISFINVPATNTEFSTGDQITFSGTAQNLSGDFEKITVFLVKESGNLTNDEIREENSIVAFTMDTFEENDNQTFEGSITVGVPMDNNNPAGLIDDWNLGDAFLLGKVTNTYGLSGYSLRRHIKVSAK